MGEETIPSRVRIESDGTVLGTHIFDADTGHEIGCAFVQITIDPAVGWVMAVLHVLASPLDITCEAQIEKKEG